MKEKMNWWKRYDKFIQTKVNGVSEEDYNNPKKPERLKFSWGWCIFWLIFCWPIAILYAIAMKKE